MVFVKNHNFSLFSFLLYLCMIGVFVKNLIFIVEFLSFQQSF